ncbi:MAG: hypothetical protein QE271_08575 [Bacteriovoracaceae bacterium]|nr:hypothetical protein [Bacteriovoracaceae bacterium]
MSILRKVTILSVKFFVLLALENAFAESVKVEETASTDESKELIKPVVAQKEKKNFSHSKSGSEFHSKSGNEAIKNSQKRRDRRHHEFMNRK